MGHCGCPRAAPSVRRRGDLRVVVPHRLCSAPPMTTASFRTESWWHAARVIITALLVVFLIAPMIIVLIISFSTAQFLSFPPPGYSLQWYRKLFADPAWAD